METSVKNAKLDNTTTLLRQVRRELPTILREKVGTGHADWVAFLKAVRDVDIDYIKDSIEIRNKELEEKKAITQRLRLLEAVSKSPTAPIRQQLSAVSLANQAAVPSTPAIGDPFMNAGGGQGNIRFTASNQPNRQTRNPTMGPRAPPTPEQVTELCNLLLKFPQHPNTQAGHQGHQAQQAEWVRTYGYGTKVTEKTPYPLHPGTAPVNSGECFTCGQLGHVGARSGADCEALGFRPLHPNEQLWRVICARVLKEPKVTTNIQFIAVDDYGTTLQDIQGNGEGPST